MTKTVVAVEQNDALEVAVVALLNVAVPEHTCLMCGQHVEHHAEGCPILGLERWLNPFRLGQALTDSELV